MTAIKKVVLVVTKSNFGGAQRYCLDLARELAGRDIAVAVAHGPAPTGHQEYSLHTSSQRISGASFFPTSYAIRASCATSRH